MADIHSLLFKKKELDPISRFKKKYQAAKVVQFDTKFKVNKIQENHDIQQKSYLRIIEDYFPQWNATLAWNRYNDFINAATFLSNIFEDIWYDPDRYAEIYLTNIDNLDYEGKFTKSLLYYLVNPNDNLNYRNLKFYLEKLTHIDSQNNATWKNLYEYFDFIIEATIFALENQEYSVNMNFFYLTTSF